MRDLADRVAAGNRPAASSRSRSRRCCSAGVYPPRCAYRIPRSYARSQPTSRPELYQFNLVKCSPTREPGGIILIICVLQLLAAAGVVAGNQLARWVAVVALGLNAIDQMSSSSPTRSGR